MSKFFAIYLCLLVIVLSIALTFVFPVLTILLYVREGFSGFVIFMSITTIIIEPLAIVVSYVLLTSVKDIYKELENDN